MSVEREIDKDYSLRGKKRNMGKENHLQDTTTVIFLLRPLETSAK